MGWFTNKKKKLEMMHAIRPTSKATLKMQCLMVCKGDIDEAMKLYDYFAKDMPDLPDYDPVPPTWIDNTKQTASDLMSWLGQNKDTLTQAYEFIRSIIQNRQLPAIGTEAPVAEPLAPIN